MNSFNDYLNVFVEYVTKYVTYEQMIYIFYGIIFLFLFIFFFGIFKEIKKRNMISNSISNIYDKLDKTNKQRQKEEVSDLYDIKEKESFLSKLDKKLTYSRIKEYIPFLTTELYIIIILFSTAFVYFFVQLIADSFFAGIIGAVITFAIFMAIQSFLIYRNYKLVEDSLLDFLNLLKNYSISADEITVIFHKMSKYMRDPLKTVLDECYYECQMTGDSNLALNHLEDKIEHPKFKELIRSLETCARYDADYNAAMSNCRRTVQDYIMSQKEQKVNNKIEKVNFFIIAGGCLLCIWLLSKMAGVDLISALRESTVGQILSYGMIAITALFTWTVVLFDKD